MSIKELEEMTILNTRLILTLYENEAKIVEALCERGVLPGKPIVSHNAEQLEAVLRKLREFLDAQHPSSGQAGRGKASS